MNKGYGKVYTTRIQKSHFSGLGVYDPNKVFTKPDENGKVFVNDVLSTICKKDEAIPENYVMIQGKLYRTVTIGEQVWLAENLNSVFDGIEFSTTSSVVSTPTCWYYNNENEGSTLLYNAFALSNIVVDGWRVPTSNDFITLIDFVGGSAVAGKKLKTVDAGGTDEYDFSIKMTGYRKSDGTYTDVSTDITRFWTTTNATTDNNICYSFSKNEDRSQAVSISKIAGYAVRLVKNA